MLRHPSYQVAEKTHHRISSNDVCIEKYLIARTCNPVLSGSLHRSLSLHPTLPPRLDLSSTTPAAAKSPLLPTSPCLDTQSSSGCPRTTAHLPIGAAALRPHHGSAVAVSLQSRSPSTRCSAASSARLPLSQSGHLPPTHRSPTSTRCHAQGGEAGCGDFPSRSACQIPLGPAGAAATKQTTTALRSLAGLVYRRASGVGVIRQGLQPERRGTRRDCRGSLGGKIQQLAVVGRKEVGHHHLPCSYDSGMASPAAGVGREGGEGEDPPRPRFVPFISSSSSVLPLLLLHLLPNPTFSSSRQKPQAIAVVHLSQSPAPKSQFPTLPIHRFASAPTSSTKSNPNLFSNLSLLLYAKEGVNACCCCNFPPRQPTVGVEDIEMVDRRRNRTMVYKPN